MILSLRLRKLGAGKRARRKLGRRTVKQQYEVGSDVLLLKLFSSIDHQLQSIAESTNIASCEVPHRSCAHEFATVVDQMLSSAVWSRDAPTVEMQCAAVRGFRQAGHLRPFLSSPASMDPG